MKPFSPQLAALWGMLACLMATMAPTAAAQQAIVLASTTSVENSGLLSRILPQFTRETGITVRVLAQGTGQALATAARGDADLVLAHDPEAEDKFIAAGHGMAREEIAWNDFIIVGPDTDPAHIAGNKDATAALKAIAATQAPFVSRGDQSGTNALEKRLWQASGVQPSGPWYRDIGGGMGAALNAAAAMQAYTLSDRGTWLSYRNKAGMKNRTRRRSPPAEPLRRDPAESADPSGGQARAGATPGGMARIAGRTGGDCRLHYRRASAVPSGIRPEALNFVEFCR